MTIHLVIKGYRINWKEGKKLVYEAMVPKVSFKSYLDYLDRDVDSFDLVEIDVKRGNP